LKFALSKSLELSESKFKNDIAPFIESVGRISNFEIETIKEKKKAVRAGKLTLKRGICTMI
jgi:hypothetical protein